MISGCRSPRQPHPTIFWAHSSVVALVGLVLCCSRNSGEDRSFVCRGKMAAVFAPALNGKPYAGGGGIRERRHTRTTAPYTNSVTSGTSLPLAHVRPGCLQQRLTTHHTSMEGSFVWQPQPELQPPVLLLGLCSASPFTAAAPWLLVFLSLLTATTLFLQLTALTVVDG